MAHNVTKKSLAQKIDQNFNQAVPPEAPGSFAEYSDYFSDTQMFWGKTWSELTLTQFEKSPLIFGSFPTDTLPYFLGAYMYLSLSNPGSNLDSLAYICENPLSLKQKKFRNRPKIQTIRDALTRTQLEVFCDYLSYIGNVHDTPHRDSFKFSRELLIEKVSTTPPTD